MRTAPDMEDEYDREEVDRFRFKPWMLAALAFNPSYPYWGPHEDYMMQDPRKEHKGWDSNLEVKTWPELEIKPDELNVITNWYFNATRNSQECPECGGTGYHPDALWVSESFYSHSSPFKSQTWQEEQASRILASFRFEEPRASILGTNTSPSEAILLKYDPAFREFCDEMLVFHSWSNRITEDEIDALIESDRYPWPWNDKSVRPTVADYNNKVLPHDAINRSILIRTRLQRYGIPQNCQVCEGHGYVFTEPEPHMELVLWLLHPRKGCGRAVTVKLIEENEIPAVVSFLKECYSSFTQNIWSRIL